MSDTIWVVIGLGGQVMFSLRFLLQWLTSERAGRSVIPVMFWYFSIGGSLILLAYAIHKLDPVFIVGQSAGLLIYSRNLVLIKREKDQAALAADNE